MVHVAIETLSLILETRRCCELCNELTETRKTYCICIDQILHVLFKIVYKKIEEMHD